VGGFDFDFVSSSADSPAVYLVHSRVDVDRGSVDLASLTRRSQGAASLEPEPAPCDSGDAGRGTTSIKSQ